MRFSDRTVESALVTLGSLGFALLFTFPLIRNFSQIGPGPDWDQFAESTWVSSYTVTHFGQMPHWDPFKCGGTPLLADPQARVLTPFFLLQLFFGTVGALHLDLIIHLALAWAGGYVLGRLIGLDYVAASFGAALFPASSWIFLHYAAGHISFIALLYLPWILALWLYAVENQKLLPLIGSGLFCAIGFAESGIYLAYLSAPLIGAIALGTAIMRREMRPLWSLLVMGFFALGFASIKLLPTLALQIDRPNESLEVETFTMLVQELFSRNQDMFRWLPGIAWGFYEYGAYVGPIAAVMALIGACAEPRRAFPWIAGATVSLALAAGSPHWWSPWAILHCLPLYRDEHVPSRFAIPLVMAIAPLVGLGAATIGGRRPWGVSLVILLYGAAIADFWFVDRSNIRHATEGREDGHPWSSEFRQFWDTSDRHTFAVASSNQGAVNSYAMNFAGLHAHAYNRPGYRGEQYLTSPGVLALSRWSPNELGYTVDTALPTTLVINQNYYPGWRLVQGRGEVFSLEGLLAIRLPPGRQDLRLRFRSRMFYLGATITILTLGLSLILWVRELGAERHRAYAGKKRAEFWRQQGFLTLCALGPSGQPIENPRGMPSPIL